MQKDFENQKVNSKINELLTSAPAGVPMMSAWMSRNGISPQLVNRYKKSNWIEPVGRGVWRRSGSELTWVGAVYALQQQQMMNIYPAARTALEMQGRAHYLPVGENPVLHLSVTADNKLPSWFLQQPFAEGLKQFNSSSLFNPVYVGLTEWQGKGLIVKISTPERAILEYCQLLPKHADFEEARQLMQGLTSLRPELLQNLLRSCLSIKAKRLFLALAESVAHLWYEKLNLDELELGAGKRSIIANGLLHPKFRITVPKHWVMT